jgi:predicted nucleic acid-binding protein
MTFAAAQRAIVVDASAAIGLLDDVAPWWELWRTWSEEAALLLAPTHFSAEVANVLVKRRGARAVDVVAKIERLGVIGPSLADRGLPGVIGAIQLADRHGLSVYDALYLDLALDMDGDLATADRDLAKAARAEGVTVTP